MRSRYCGWCFDEFLTLQQILCFKKWETVIFNHIYRTGSRLKWFTVFMVAFAAENSDIYWMFVNLYLQRIIIIDLFLNWMSSERELHKRLAFLRFCYFLGFRLWKWQNCPEMFDSTSLGYVYVYMSAWPGLVQNLAVYFPIRFQHSTRSAL